MFNKFNADDNDGQEGESPEESKPNPEITPNPNITPNPEITPNQEITPSSEIKSNVLVDSGTNVKEEKLESAQNEVVFPKEEDDFDFNNPVRCNFKKLKFKKNDVPLTSEELNKFGGSYGMFYCEKEYIGEFKCSPENNLSCPSCMKLNQKYYGLNSKYLINHRGKVCTLKNNKIYCKSKLRKEEKSEINGITYSFNYVCGHSGQCDGCKRLTEFVDKYYSPKLLEKLRNKK